MKQNPGWSLSGGSVLLMLFFLLAPGVLRSEEGSTAAPVCQESKVNTISLRAASFESSTSGAGCGMGEGHTGWGWGISDWSACTAATDEVNNACVNGLCLGCCRLEECNCGCFAGSGLCLCSRVGYECTIKPGGGEGGEGGDGDGDRGRDCSRPQPFCPECPANDCCQC